MHLSAGISLALLSGAASIVSGFSLKPVTTPIAAQQPAVGLFGRRRHRSTANPVLRHIAVNSNLSTRSPSITVRGGSSVGTLDGDSSDGSTSSSGGGSLLKQIINVSASFWAAGGVVAILGKSIKRIVPIALEPFGKAAPVPLSTFELGSYIAMCLWFAYVEGYKGFQLKFSPLVVARAQTLKPIGGKTPIHHILLGPFYAMGLFHATKKRKIVSWSVSLGVGMIVALVKRFPYPWRNIVDAGVIVGLTWGSLSILGIWCKAVILGKDVDMDPALPEKKE